VRRMAFASALLVASPTFAEPVHLSCLAQGERYVFTFDEAARSLDWITANGAHRFEIVHLDNKQVNAGTDSQFNFGLEYDELGLNLSRISGGLELTWSRKPTMQEKAKCRAEHGISARWCEDYFVIRTISGQCSRIERLF
jgi:hypothetical protein